MSTRFLTALPVFNEESHVQAVLAEVRRYAPNILVVNDGSTDGTAALLATEPGIQVVTHAKNRGYGAALITAFDSAIREGYDVLVTIDCDGQHEPQRIPEFVAACTDVDIVSGSRYLQDFEGDNAAPEDRRRINMQVTQELNRRLGYQLTDSFCGFKAYRAEGLAKLKLTEAGYAMPLELWVRAAAAGLKVKELPVPRIYLEEKRSFGGALDDAATRVQYYHLVLDRSVAALEDAYDCAGVLCTGASD
ncbi:MAG: glycosyltransferase family 2 protein [Planctomycetia bacterium]|nr:glycosyltransferase family 2 protein [Planctomycetia bacterium]